jgi:hypothetical protein
VDLGDITYTDLPAGVDGLYADDHIWVQKNLPYRVKHCTETHERFHKYLRHEPIPPGPEYHARELLVDELTARHLVPFRALLEGLAEHIHPSDLSRVWGVDVATVQTRLMTITPEERIFVELCGTRCNRG